MTDKADLSKVALVTGATSGLGLAIAEGLAKAGYRVFGTGRSWRGAARGFTYIPMDLLDLASIRAAVEVVVETASRLDILVACAGMGTSGSVEEMNQDDAMAQINTNFMGTAMTVKAVLPWMRKQENGKIIVVSSIAGRMGMPFQAYYAASKFALEGFCESLRFEVRGFGIQVCLLEPGDFATGFTVARKKFLDPKSPYKDLFSHVLCKQENDEMHGSNPSLAAKEVLRLVRRRALPVRKSVGPLIQRIAAVLKGLIPGSLFEKLYNLYYGIK
ncbi:MAG: oxidoreductase [Spirochaetes bacterium]|nr:MAG: oxidoreductase [Spirochaetota bacterium]